MIHSLVADAWHVYDTYSWYRRIQWTNTYDLHTCIYLDFVNHLFLTSYFRFHCRLATFVVLNKAVSVSHMSGTYVPFLSFPYLTWHGLTLQHHTVLCSTDTYRSVYVEMFFQKFPHLFASIQFNTLFWCHLSVYDTYMCMLSYSNHHVFAFSVLVSSNLYIHSATAHYYCTSSLIGSRLPYVCSHTKKNTKPDPCSRPSSSTLFVPSFRSVISFHIIPPPPPAYCSPLSCPLWPDRLSKRCTNLLRNWPSNEKEAHSYIFILFPVLHRQPCLEM